MLRRLPWAVFRCLSVVIVGLAGSISFGVPPVACGDESSVTAQKKPAFAKNNAETSPGNSDYTNITGFVKNANLPIEQPVVLWKVVSQLTKKNGDALPLEISNVVAADGILYFGDDKGTVVALSADTQTELWSHPHGARVYATPSVDRDFVYFGTKYGVTALHRSNGEVAWRFAVDHGAEGVTPLPVGDHLYFSGCDGHVYCRNRKTGAAVWKHDLYADAPKNQQRQRALIKEAVARPNGAACDGKLFIQSVFDQSRVIAVDCSTGKRQWTFQTEGWISPAPTIADGRVFVVSQDKHLYCLDLSTGTMHWKFKAPHWLASQVAVHEGQVYLPCHKGRLFQLSADTGNLMRTMESPDEADRDGLVYSFPIIANQTAYFATGKGLLLAFDLESGALRWKIRPSEGSELFTNPVTDGRQIFVTTRPTQEKTGESAIVAIGIDH